VLEGVQHPPPWIDCQVRWIGEDLVGSATFAEAVFGGRRLSADPPTTEVRLMLYCQVLQADGEAHRNILVGRKQVQRRRHERIRRVEGGPQRPAGYTSWTAAEIEQLLATLGLPDDMPLSVLAVETLPEPNATFHDPLGGDLARRRWSRSTTSVDNGADRHDTGTGHGDRRWPDLRVPWITADIHESRRIIVWWVRSRTAW
jgi:hypothetical protein